MHHMKCVCGIKFYSNVNPTHQIGTNFWKDEVILRLASYNRGAPWAPKVHKGFKGRHLRRDKFWTQAAITFICGTYGNDFIIFEKPVQKAFQKMHTFTSFLPTALSNDTTFKNMSRHPNSEWPPPLICPPFIEL